MGCISLVDTCIFNSSSTPYISQGLNTDKLHHDKPSPHLTWDSTYILHIIMYRVQGSSFTPHFCPPLLTLLTLRSPQREVMTDSIHRIHTARWHLRSCWVVPGCTLYIWTQGWRLTWTQHYNYWDCVFRDGMFYCYYSSSSIVILLLLLLMACVDS